MLKQLGVATLGVGVGIVAVSGVAQSVVGWGPTPPPFDVNSNRFSAKTFQGRWFQMLSNFDPSTLTKTDSEVKDAAQAVKLFEQDRKAASLKYSNTELWYFKSVKDSAVHPDTGEIIPRPFRMSGYVPFNGPVCVAMMVSQATPTLLLWNWVNQSHNALVNYFNRNASTPMTNEQIGISYCTAVVAAVAVAFGVSQFIKRRHSKETAVKLLKFVAFPASMVASSSNAFIMRRHEMKTGIPVFDEEGESVSKTFSRKAAQKAVKETVLSRAILQVPVFFLPPLFLSIPPLSTMTAASATLSLGAMAFLTTVSFGIGLPAAVAVFPVRGEIAVAELEPELQAELVTSKNSNAKILFYNKGL